jgi:hypothetical protein
MAENKTKPNYMSVAGYLNTFDSSRQEEASTLILMFKDLTHEEPVMWGGSIIGFGNKIYNYASGRKVEYFLIGFSIRKKAITIYLMNLGSIHDFSMLGKHEKGVGCLYIKSLNQINLSVLQGICEKSIKEAIESK